jgi:hypothetical protein
MKRWCEIDVVGVPGTPHSLIVNDGSDYTFSVVIDSFCSLAKVFFNTATDFVSAELWSQPTDSDNPVFLELVSPAVSGTSANPLITYGQWVITLHTTEGIVQRMYMMESVLTVNQIVNFPVPAGTIKSFVDYLAGTTGPIRTRTGGKIVAGKRYLTKTNDMLRRRGQNI